MRAASARRLARAARLLAGVVRPDAVFAEAGRAPLCLLGDVVAVVLVSLLRGVGPVLIINTVVVVAPAGILGGCIPTAEAKDAWPAAILRLDQSKLLSGTTKRRL